MNILIIISLSISVFSLTVAFFMYLALLTLKQQNDTIIKDQIEKEAFENLKKMSLLEKINKIKEKKEERAEKNNKKKKKKKNKKAEKRK